MISLSSSQAIAADLSALIEGEILSEDWETVMYASDASIYEIKPQCVAVPKNKDDVLKIVNYCVTSNIPIIPRGGGSGLAGQAIGNGVVIDFTKHMNSILEVNTEENYVIVQPGVYKSVLDNFLKEHGKFLPPDPSSSEQCTLGGMISTNASGPHTVKYGSTIDYVLSLEVILSNGDLITTSSVPYDSETWNELSSGDSFISNIYRNIRTIVDSNVDLLSSNMPDVKKNSCGYRLEKITENNVLDLSKLFTCAEGTLGVILEAKLSITNLPKFKTLALVQLSDILHIDLLMEPLLSLNPSSVELLDAKIIDVAKVDHPHLSELINPYSKIILLIEFDGYSFNAPKNSLAKLTKLFKSLNLPKSSLIESFDEQEMSRLWEVRKKSQPYAQKLRLGNKRPVPFMEDTSVNPCKLGEYINSLYSLFTKYNLQSIVYGHAGDGNVHIRPLLDLKNPDDLSLMKILADESLKLVKRFNGSITGEHGDGLARAPYVNSQYGDEIYSLFLQVKSLLDPNGIMNPDKKIVLDTDLTSNLRYGENYSKKETNTILNWGIQDSNVIKNITGYASELDYDSETELCHGCGYCHSSSYITRMCPLYNANYDEIDSCRGRNNLLRWLLKKDGLTKDFQFTNNFEDAVFNHCIQCKMCYTDCPSNVNVGKLMAESRAQYVQERGLPKGYSHFMNIDKFGELGVLTSPVSNWLLSNKQFRSISEYVTGIDKRRNFPKFANKTFSDILINHPRKSGNKNIALFYDTYINYNNPSLGLRIIEIFRKNGINVILPPQQSSGLPAILDGRPDIGAKIAESNVSSLVKYVNKGIPIVSFSPSATLSLKLEYLNVYDTSDTRLVSDNTYDIHEYLYNLYQSDELNLDLSPINKEIYLHRHCHNFALRTENYPSDLLSLIPELKINILEHGCCGIGGTFGFVKKGYDQSMAVGKSLFEIISNSNLDVYTTGESCMLQLAQGSGKKIGMTLDLLSDSYLI